MAVSIHNRKGGAWVPDTMQWQAEVEQALSHSMYPLPMWPRYHLPLALELVRTTGSTSTFGVADLVASRS